jgi:hypothetical protein
MVVVVHQTPRIAQPVELLCYLGKDIQKGLPIKIAIEDVFAPVSARGDVVQRVWKFDPDGA